MFNSANGLILNNILAQTCFCYINIANTVIMINAFATFGFYRLLTIGCFPCMLFSCQSSIINSKCMVPQCMSDVSTTSDTISFFLACLLAFLPVNIAVNKVNLPVTRALVRTRTTIEKYIFHSQRIHKPRQLHSTYTSSHIQNRA